MIRDMIARFFWRQFGKPSGLFGRYIGNGMARGNEYDASWTVSLLDIQPESRVVEIGFGPGVSTQFAAEKASTGFVAGIDRSETMVQAARKRNTLAIQGGRMELKQGDVASLSYPGESFDKAFSLHSIYFWDNPVDCIKELRRVLKPEGLLAITILPRNRWSAFRQRGSSLRKLYLSTELATMFEDAGLQDVRVEVSHNPDKPIECVLGVK